MSPLEKKTYIFTGLHIIRVRGASCDHTGGDSFSKYMAVCSETSRSQNKLYQGVKRQDIASDTVSSQQATPLHTFFLPSPDKSLSENETDRDSSTAMVVCQEGVRRFGSRHQAAAQSRARKDSVDGAGLFVLSTPDYRAIAVMTTWPSTAANTKCPLHLCGGKDSATQGSSQWLLCAT